MKNNKKGFTLIELLAVIVVLAILMLTAGTSVFNLISDARKNNFRNEFLSLLEAGALQAQMDMMNTGTLGSTKQYAVHTATSAGGLQGRWDNKGDYYGCVQVTDDGSGKLTVKGWLRSTQLVILNQGTDITVDKVNTVNADTVSNENIEKCLDANPNP